MLTIRRRANIACAEHALALMLAQARKLDRMVGRVTAAKLAAEGHPYKPFDRRHTPNSNWGAHPRHPHAPRRDARHHRARRDRPRDRIPRRRLRHAHPLFPAPPLPEADERALGVDYAPLDTLLAEADWMIPQLPEGPSTRNLIGAAQLARMKPGAFIVNVSRPDVIDRAALIEALKSGRLGGFALDPLYEAPARDDDELLQLKNVILVPHLAGHRGSMRSPISTTSSPAWRGRWRGRA